jgi:hypothetical protein
MAQRTMLGYVARGGVERGTPQHHSSSGTQRRQVGVRCGVP